MRPRLALAAVLALTLTAALACDVAPPAPAPPTSAPAAPVASAAPSAPAVSAAPAASAPEAPPEAQHRDALAQVARWEEARALGGGEDGLGALSRHAAPVVRARAALALGRVGAGEGLDLLAPLMGDPDAAVRGAAAFGVGLIAAEHEDDPRLIARARQLLLGAWAREQDRDEAPEARRRVVWALRRVGGEDARGVVDALLQAAQRERPAVQAEALRSLALLARAAPKTPGLDGADVLTTLQRAAASPEAEVREAALYAALRLKRPDAQPLLAATLAGDAEARPEEAALALRALAALQSFDVPRARVLLLGAAEGPASQHHAVRLEALRHLISAHTPLAVAAVEAFILQHLGPLEADGTLPDGDELHLLLLAVESRGADWDARPRALLRRVLEASAHPRLKRAEGSPSLAVRSVQLECTAAVGVDFLSQEVQATPRCGDGLPSQMTPALRASYEADVIQRLKRPALKRLELLEALYRRSDDPGTQAAALYAVQSLLPEDGAPVDKALQRELPRLRAAVDRLGRDAAASADPVVRATGLGLVGRANQGDAAAFVEGALARLDPLQPPGEQLDVVLETLDSLKRLGSGAETVARWLANPTPVVRQRAAATLARLQPEQPLTLPSPEPPPARPERVGQPRRTFTLTTTRGPITLELWPDLAPGAVASFEALAARGFYDRLLFHRVIPGFVAQGGDPRGDGSGGPGTPLNAEWSDARFTPGTLGMAHAGKDTAGSQFFITTGDHPHLDGGYTAFGRVVEGQDIARSLLVGDRIVKVTPPGP